MVLVADAAILPPPLAGGMAPRIAYPTRLLRQFGQPNPGQVSAGHRPTATGPQQPEKP